MVFIYVGLKTGKEYTRTVRDRLADGGGEVDTSDFDARNLLTVTLTRMDLQAELAKAGVILDGDGDVLAGTAGERSGSGGGEGGASILTRIESSDNTVVERALTECASWDASHVEALTRLLARSQFYKRAVDALLTIGEPTLDHLTAVLLDEHADFVIRRRIPRRPLRSRLTGGAPGAARSPGRGPFRGPLPGRDRSGAAPGPRPCCHAGRLAADRVARRRARGEPRSSDLGASKILDGSEAGDDDFVGKRVDVRGELSLEHTFRQLSLVLDPAAVKMAFHGIIMDDENLQSLALEYLEQVLPPEIRARLWPFIGDISEYQRRQSMRSVDEVVGELSQTGATLFGGVEERAALDQALREHGHRPEEDETNE